MRATIVLGLTIALSCKPQPSGNDPMVRTRIVEKAVPSAISPTGTVVEGSEKLFEVQLVPDAVQAVLDTEVIEYHADISSNVSGSGAYAWSASLADDRGNVVSSLGAGDGKLEKGGVASTSALVAHLPDGFYVLRVLAAFHSANWEDAAEGVQFLRVKGTKMREMSAADWYRSSRATLATPLDGQDNSNPQGVTVRPQSKGVAQ